MLLSRSFRPDERLNRCSLDNAAHVTPGTKGPFVCLIQRALCAVDGAQIAEAEMREQTYGKTTAAAVLNYKTARAIINYSYQTKPDDIVGVMTIRALDAELAATEIASIGGSMLRPPGRFF
jgi:hypothetical protein